MYGAVKGDGTLRIIYRGENLSGFLWTDSYPEGTAENRSIYRLQSGDAFQETNRRIMSSPILRGQRWVLTCVFTWGSVGVGEQRHNWIESPWLFLLLPSRTAFRLVSQRGARETALLSDARGVINCFVCWSEGEEWIWETGNTLCASKIFSILWKFIQIISHSWRSL